MKNKNNDNYAIRHVREVYINMVEIKFMLDEAKKKNLECTEILENLQDKTKRKLSEILIDKNYFTSNALFDSKNTFGNLDSRMLSILKWNKDHIGFNEQLERDFIYILGEILGNTKAKLYDNGLNIREDMSGNMITENGECFNKSKIVENINNTIDKYYI